VYEQSSNTVVAREVLYLVLYCIRHCILHLMMLFVSTLLMNQKELQARNLT